VVRARHAFDLLGTDLEETPASRDSRVQDEQVDRRMALTHALGGPLDVLPVGDVAALRLGAQLRGDLLQALLAAGEENELEAALAQTLGDRAADPTRPTRDDCDADGGTLALLHFARREHGAGPLAR